VKLEVGRRGSEAVSSGSNYVYSAYAPQLATQLVISSTQVNLIGLAGNLGMYLTGPLCVP
jgi:hypothetical protein